MLIKRGQRILGICLGAQILFEFLHEGSLTRGLSYFKGDVKSMNIGKSNTGWSDFYLNKNQLSSEWLERRMGENRKR